MNETQPFWNNSGVEINWNSTDVLLSSKKELEEMHKMLNNEKQNELLEQRNELAAPMKLTCCKAPPLKKCKKALNMNPCDYVATRYAETSFRGNTRTIIFVSPIVEDGQQNTDEETPIWGAFLQEKINKTKPLCSVFIAGLDVKSV